MKKLGIIASVVVFCVVVLIWIMNIFNTEISLDNRYDAQFNVVETQMDNMRKTLMNQHSVTESFAEDFIKVASVQSDGRKGGGLLKFSTESQSLGITPELYATMLASIQGELDDFTRQQNTLTDIWREHTTYCEQFPNRFLIGGEVNPKPEMITSTISKDAMKTGELNDNLLGE